MCHADGEGQGGQWQGEAVRHVQDNQRISPSQCRFMKGRSCLTNLISFCDKATCLVDERKAVDIVYQEFRKAVDTVSHSVLLENWLLVAWTDVLYAG